MPLTYFSSEEKPKLKIDIFADYLNFVSTVALNLPFYVSAISKISISKALKLDAVVAPQRAR
jgi:hypothetical protein